MTAFQGTVRHSGAVLQRVTSFLPHLMPVICHLRVGRKNLIESERGFFSWVSAAPAATPHAHQNT
jgi:hypothetical protein